MRSSHCSCKLQYIDRGDRHRLLWENETYLWNKRINLKRLLFTLLPTSQKTCAVTYWRMAFTQQTPFYNPVSVSNLFSERYLRSVPLTLPSCCQSNARVVSDMQSFPSLISKIINKEIKTFYVLSTSEEQISNTSQNHWPLPLHLIV